MSAERHVNPELNHFGTFLWGRRCTRRCSLLFEKLRRHINRLEREIERLRRQIDEARKKSADDEKRIAELEKENSKLKRDLEAKALQPDKPDSLSTPSAMRPVYTKPPASKRRRKPRRKKEHPGACRPAPVHIDQVVETLETSNARSAQAGHLPHQQAIAARTREETYERNL
jgi:hypothetical protein